MQPVAPRLNLSHPLAKDCVAYYLFGHHGGQIASNLSGNVPHLFMQATYRNTVSVSDSPWGSSTRMIPDPPGNVQGWFGHNLNEFAAGDGREAASLVDVPAAMFSLRFRFDPPNRTHPTIVYMAERTNGANVAQSWLILADTSVNEARFYYSGVWIFTASVNILDGEWHHFVMTISAPKLSEDPGNEFYVDGVASNTYSGQSVNVIPAGTTTPHGSNCFMTTPRTTGYEFAGWIDHFAIFSRCRLGVGFYTADDARLLFDDPYGVIRPDPDVDSPFFEAPAPPSDFEAHRMLLTT